MNKINKSAVAALALATFFVACEKETSTNKAVESNAYVVNEGGFLKNNGSISSINEGTASNNLFLSANGVGVGDVIQHIGFTESNAYVVANNSQKVEVVSIDGFTSVATVTDASLNYPRYAQGVAGNVYVTNGFGDGNVAVIDGQTNNVMANIAVGTAPGKMAVVGNTLFVLNSGGFATAGDTNSVVNGSVSVINTSTNVETKRTELFPQVKDIVVDANNNVYVLCSGVSVYSADFSEIIKQTPPYLVQLNSNGDIVSSTKIGDASDKPSQLEIAADGKLYMYQSGNVFSYSNGDKGANVVSGANAYGMNIGPDNLVYLSLAGNFQDNGFVARYSLNGNFVDSIPVGIAPNGVYFN